MIFFYNRWHHGDLMTQIMLMQKIKREYPDLEIGCCCYYNHAKLLKDMGINVIHVSQVMPTRGAISDDRFVDRIIKEKCLVGYCGLKPECKTNTEDPALAAARAIQQHSEE